MGRFRVEIMPFDDDGNYTDWVDVTDDIDQGGISAMKQQLDNTEYDIGIFQNAAINLALMNYSGAYSDVGQPGSMFKFRRSNSLVRISWFANEGGNYCGFVKCGFSYLEDEEGVVAFIGLLDDTALKQNADDQSLKFKVLGKESILDEEIVPFADISVGDTFSEILYACLNQTLITNILTIDIANITPALDLVTDAIADLENKTVKEAVNLIMLYSNSVLYVKDDTVYVTARTASVDLKQTFYGQGSTAGIEDIIDIKDFRIGLNRLYNFITWTDTALVSQDLSSIGDHGYQKKDLSTSLITDDAKRQQILDAIKVEFRNPKREMTLTVPLTHDTIALNVLDKISVDYPNVGIDAGGGIPTYDLSVYDVARYPYEVLPLSIESVAEFKVLSKDIDPVNHEVILTIREV